MFIFVISCTKEYLALKENYGAVCGQWVARPVQCESGMVGVIHTFPTPTFTSSVGL